jgi:hypothetical protein
MKTTQSDIRLLTNAGLDCAHASEGLRRMQAVLLTLIAERQVRAIRHQRPQLEPLARPSRASRLRHRAQRAAPFACPQALHATPRFYLIGLTRKLETDARVIRRCGQVGHLSC